MGQPITNLLHTLYIAMTPDTAIKHRIRRWKMGSISVPESIMMNRRLDLSELPVTTLPHPRHPLGSRARILLTSVFGPYAQDDEYGSRALNPMELYHNQVTRVQGPFSLRMFHRSWGLMLIQSNVQAPCTLVGLSHPGPLRR